MPKGHMKKIGRIKEKKIVKRKVRAESENETITRVEAISRHVHTSCTFRGMDLISVVEKVMSEMNELSIEDVNDTEEIKFDNTQTLEDTILRSIIHHVRVQLQGAVEYEYFPGLCKSCSAFSTPARPLLCCPGCQLVSYCSKKCIKEDKNNHKEICKCFAVKLGKNVFTAGRENRENRNNWNSFLEDLYNKAKKISDKIESRMFLQPRMCPICNETRFGMLKDCACCCVAYCSEEHRRKDEDHLQFCEEMLLCAKVYAYRKHHHVDTVHVPQQIDRVYKLLPSINVCTDPKWYRGNSSILDDQWFTEKKAILSERLSYPLTIINQLEKLGVSSRKTPLSDVTSLEIHMCCTYAMFDAEIWEYAMHRLPALRRLSITYLGEKNLSDRTKNYHQTCRRLKRCNDCLSLGRYITFAMYPQQYHMFFSSEHYKEPDVVAVYSGLGLPEDEPEEEVHTTMSYRNMTYSKDTTVIVTDYSRERMTRNIDAINEARKDVGIETPTERNPYYGFKNQRTLSKDSSEEISISSERLYVAALRRTEDDQEDSDDDDSDETDSDYDLE